MPRPDPQTQAATPPLTPDELSTLAKEVERQMSVATTALTLPDLYDRAREAEQALLTLARTNVNVFCEFVLKDEATGGDTIQAPIHIEWHRLAERHKRLLIWSHVEAGKTTQMAIGRTLWLLGRNPSLRLAVISNTHGQAEKIVRQVAGYIERSAELRAVFPHLVPDKVLPWTSSKLYVKRSTLSKDPSLQAFGIHGAVMGTRIDGLLLDDVLDYENTKTPEARKDLWDWYHSTLVGRLTEDAFVTIIGNAYHPDDLLHRLAATSTWEARRFPVYKPNGDPAWPERWSHDRIERKRLELIAQPAEFARQMLCQARSDEDARFKREWIERCLRRGNGKTFAHALKALPPGCKTYTGVDLAVQQHAAADLTVLFTILVHGNGDREILCIESGRWAGPDIITRIRDAHWRYGSTCVVENNAAQDYIVQMLSATTSVPVIGYTTGRNKADPAFGVEQMANELAAAKWIIPNVNGQAHPEVDAWINEMLFYVPGKHTGDRLMASWLAKEGVRKGEIVAEAGHVDLMRR